MVYGGSFLMVGVSASNVSIGIGKASNPRAGSLAHVPEKWLPVSRLREARQSPSLPYLHAASAGEGRSEKDMRQRKNLERIPILSKRDAL